MAAIGISPADTPERYPSRISGAVPEYREYGGSATSGSWPTISGVRSLASAARSAGQRHAGVRGFVTSVTLTAANEDGYRSGLMHEHTVARRPPAWITVTATLRKGLLDEKLAANVSQQAADLLAPCPLYPSVDLGA